MDHTPHPSRLYPLYLLVLRLWISIPVRMEFVHRDIAVRNFLVDVGGRVMLFDFGLTNMTLPAEYISNLPMESLVYNICLMYVSLDFFSSHVGRTP